MMLTENISAIMILLGSMSFVLFMTFAISKTKMFKEINKDKKSLILVSIFFGLLSIYGTMSAIDFIGAKINIRDIAPMVAGFVGGPLAGFIAGVIGGVQRIFMGGPTVLACSVSTILLGLSAGILSLAYRERKVNTGIYLLVGALLEAVHMLFVLLFTSPAETAITIASNISIPMIVFNAIGLYLAMYIIDNQDASKAKK